MHKRVCEQFNPQREPSRQQSTVNSEKSVFRQIVSTGSNREKVKMKALIDQNLQKTIPNAEMLRLFSGIPLQPLMDGGFLSERDVCCRINGLVSIPQINFSMKEYSTKTDQLKPIELLV